MNYQNPYLNPYGFMQQAQMPQIPQPVQSQQIVRVNGENGAKSYQMGANSSAILLDESGLLIWVCTTDGAGYKTVSAYDISPHQDAPAPNYTDLETRVQNIEKRLGELTNGTATDSSATRKKPTAKPNDGED